MTVVAPFPARDQDHDSRQPASADAMRRELHAMRVIGRALLGLPEGRARTRVLEWAMEVASAAQPAAARFAAANPDARSSVTASPEPKPPSHDEVGLSLEGIESLFDESRPSPGQFPPSTGRRWARRRFSPRLLFRLRWWR